MPRERIRAPGHDRERSLGHLALAWIEHFCVHGPGDIEGTPLAELPLDDEFAGFILDAYALDKAGRRTYDSAFLSRAKGRAKSELAGFFVLFEAMGPCRFAGWAKGGEKFRWRDFTYPYLPGEPMGKLVTYPFVRCLATEEEQSGNTYDNVYFNLTEGPLSEGLPRDAAGLTRTLLPGGGEIRPSTAANASKDGGKETFVVFDETHLYILPMLRRMYKTVRRNLAKRKGAEGWSLETSTMYLPGENSVAEATHKLARAIKAKRTKRARLLFDHREAPPDIDLFDEDELRAGLAEAYGRFFEAMDVQRLIDEIWDPRNDAQDSRRYFLNQPTSAHDAWIAAYELEPRRRPKIVVVEKELIAMGFDGSKGRARGVTDATALIGCRISDAHLFKIGIWEQPEQWPRDKEWRVPVGAVNAAVQKAFRTYDVCAFFADPAHWETYVAAWEAKYGKKLVAKSTRDHPIEWWMTGGRASRMVQAYSEFLDAVILGEMTYDGDEAFTRHLLNARRRPSTAGLLIGKEHPDSPNKIDAAPAATLALRARKEAIAKGAGARKKSKRIVRH